MYYSNPLSLLQQALVAVPGGAPAPAAPSFYGPMHQQLSDYFNSGAQWRAQMPTYVNQLMFQPALRSMHGGFNLDTYTPKMPPIPLVNWFPEKPGATAADPLGATSLPPAQPSPLDGLLGGGGVRPGQNDVGGA